jgi:hypothetical protein
MHAQQRSMSVLAATLAALALGAAPALAGEDDDDEDSGDTPAQVSPPATSGGGSSGSGAVPQGGVATGLGGTADTGPDGVLVGLGAGSLLLLATGGGLVAVGRRRP